MSCLLGWDLVNRDYFMFFFGNRLMFYQTETALSAEGISLMADNGLDLIHIATTNYHMVSVHHIQKSAS